MGQVELIKGILAEIDDGDACKVSTALITATLTNSDLRRVGREPELDTIGQVVELLDHPRLAGAVVYEMLGLILTLLREVARTHDVDPHKFLQLSALRREAL